MNRAVTVPVPADFNPVYPYDQEKRNINLMPPFYSGDGFGEGPTSVLTLDCADPISVATGQLGLKFGESLQLNSEGQLETKATTINALPPLNFTDDELSLATGDGLEVKNNKLQVMKGPGLYFATGALSIDIGDGLEYNFNQLQCKPGTGLELGDRSIRITQPVTPLTFNGNKLFLNTGFGLTQLSGKLVLEYGGHYTLWTTPDPITNCEMEGTLDTKLWLALTLSEGLVIGTIAVEGIGNNARIQQGTSKILKLVFDSNGILQKEFSDLKGTWGFKKGQSVDLTSTLNAKKLMPNKQMYPTQNREIRADIYLNPIIQDNNNNNNYGLNLRVGLNQWSTTAYSLMFTWTLPLGSTDLPFKTSSTSFCYIPEVVQQQQQQ